MLQHVAMSSVNAPEGASPYTPPHPLCKCVSFVLPYFGMLLCCCLARFVYTRFCSSLLHVRLAIVYLHLQQGSTYTCGYMCTVVHNETVLLCRLPAAVPQYNTLLRPRVGLWALEAPPISRVPASRHEAWQRLNTLLQVPARQGRPGTVVGSGLEPFWSRGH